MNSSLVPEGYEPMTVHGPMAEALGPFYATRLDSGEFRYGIVAEERHENPMHVVHGGMLFTFADQILGHAVVTSTARHCTTITANVDFLAAAKAGHWIDGRTEVVNVTRSLAFVRAMLYAGEQALLNVNSVFRLLGDLPPREKG